MKKLLLTGFEPFGGETVNPSWEAVDRFPAEMSGYTLTKLRLPVVFGEAASAVLRVAEETDFDVILCIGQAGGRQAITPELVGINLRHAPIPDNKGNRPKDQSILTQGNTAYFSTLPVRQMADAISRAGILSQVSYSAGAYVCNDLLYTLLACFQGSRTRVGFIHIPYSTEQGKEPSMDLDQMIRGLTVAIQNMD